MIAAERLAGLDLFRDIRGDAIAALARRAVAVRFAPNDVVFLAGAAPRGWWIVIDGRIRVVRGEGARQHVVHTEGPGGTLGEVPMFAGGTHPATGIAAEPSCCALVTKESLEAAIAEAPAIAFVVARSLAKRVRHLVDRLDDRSAHSVQARVIDFLLSRPRLRESSISLGMTQQALAEELGTVREVISRELRALAAAKLIESLGGGRYRIPDVNALRAATASHDLPRTEGA
jgi:CRP/FNR family transcriptional regulator